MTSRDPYLRVYFAQISPFDFGAEMKAMKEPERLSPKFPKNAISEKKCLLANTLRPRQNRQCMNRQ